MVFNGGQSYRLQAIDGSVPWLTVTCTHPDSATQHHCSPARIITSPVAGDSDCLQDLGTVTQVT
jgi:hypothetical protein